MLPATKIRHQGHMPLATQIKPYVTSNDVTYTVPKSTSDYYSWAPGLGSLAASIGNTALGFTPVGLANQAYEAGTEALSDIQQGNEQPTYSDTRPFRPDTAESYTEQDPAWIQAAQALQTAGREVLPVAAAGALGWKNANDKATSIIRPPDGPPLAQPLPKGLPWALATEPNPLRPGSTFDNLRQVLTSGDTYNRTGVTPNLPPVEYMEDPLVQEVFGMPTDRLIVNGMHRSSLGAYAGAPIAGSKMPLLYDASTGRPATFMNGGVYPFNIHPQVKAMSIVQPTSVVDKYHWGEGMSEDQGAAFGSLARSGMTLPQMIADFTQGGSNAETGELIPHQSMQDMGTHIYQSNDYYTEPLFQSISNEADRLVPNLRGPKAKLNVVASYSGNPALKWVAQKAMENPHIINDYTNAQGVRAVTLDGGWLNDQLMKEMGKTYKPGWTRVGGDQGFERVK